MKKSVRTAAIALAVSPLIGLALAAPASAETTYDSGEPVPIADLVTGSLELGNLMVGVGNAGVDFGSLGTGSTKESTGSVGSLGSTDEGSGSGSSTGSLGSSE
ncbi:hypothetical protein BFN03_03965 [Rhodococcus sp. WMMA185]|uniref:hypothetical protein n=1 Tax=Rhodococcus sp. WMMA185 TaxID=679318 RepID=UPI0008782E8B|nr:hypothetical protein [Rhodococcus sp. WMMA185]AOW92144.1 hypothetical protein BFN03_03965 [Rhodococcus sp. WMMA185]